MFFHIFDVDLRSKLVFMHEHVMNNDVSIWVVQLTHHWSQIVQIEHVITLE